MSRGKEKITMTRDRFHVYLTAAMVLGVYIGPVFTWIAMTFR